MDEHELLSRETVERWAEAWRTILDAIPRGKRISLFDHCNNLESIARAWRAAAIRAAAQRDGKEAPS